MTTIIERDALDLAAGMIIVNDGARLRVDQTVEMTASFANETGPDDTDVPAIAFTATNLDTGDVCLMIVAVWDILTIEA